MQLQIVSPTDRCTAIVERLCADRRVTNVIRFDKVALRPEGDFIQCDIAREAVSDILDWLHSQGIDDHGSVSLVEIDSAPSPNAWAAEAAQAGALDDAIVWDAVVDSARRSVHKRVKRMSRYPDIRFTRYRVLPAQPFSTTSAAPSTAPLTSTLTASPSTISPASNFFAS